LAAVSDIPALLELMHDAVPLAFQATSRRLLASASASRMRFPSIQKR
jgi:hypothetical protein